MGSPSRGIAVIAAAGYDVAVLAALAAVAEVEAAGRQGLAVPTDVGTLRA